MVFRFFLVLPIAVQRVLNCSTLIKRWVQRMLVPRVADQLLVDPVPALRSNPVASSQGVRAQ